jgi:hypothetical protein
MCKLYRNLHINKADTLVHYRNCEKPNTEAIEISSCIISLGGLYEYEGITDN